MFASNFVARGNTFKYKLVKTNKTTLPYGGGDKFEGIKSGNYSNYESREEVGPGYVKDIKSEQEINNSGIPYRYVNSIESNKDLIIDSTKYGVPVRINRSEKLILKKKKGMDLKRPNMVHILTSRNFIRLLATLQKPLKKFHYHIPSNKIFRKFPRWGLV